MQKIFEIIKSGKVLVSDGAWGTFLFKKGLKTGDCPELWNLTNREDVLSIAQSYIDAGSDIIETNSFGASSFKLRQYNLENKIDEINQIAAEISRQAAGNEKFVMGSVGPTGKFLMMGDVTQEELYESFKKQAVAFEKGGANAVCIETFYALDEAEQAIKAVKENTELEVFCTFTFDKTNDGSYKSLMGVSPQQMTESLILCGADIIGANCSVGYEAMITITKNIREVSKEIPILVQANAGMPKIGNGNLVYSETPEFIKDFIPRIIDAGANIIGGCCGTTPEHIRVIKTIVSEHNQQKNL